MMKRLLAAIILACALPAFAQSVAVTNKNTVTKDGGALTFSGANRLCFVGSSSGSACLTMPAVASSSASIINGALGYVPISAGGWTNDFLPEQLFTGPVVTQIPADVAAAQTSNSFTGFVETTIGEYGFTNLALGLAGSGSNYEFTMGSFGIEGLLPALHAPITQGDIYIFDPTDNQNYAWWYDLVSMRQIFNAGNVPVDDGVHQFQFVGTAAFSSTVTATDFIVGSTSIRPIRCVSGALSGALTLGSVNTATATCTGATNAMAVACSYTADPGTLIAAPKCVVSSTNTVTVTESGLGIVTPASTTVQISVTP